MQVIPAIDLKGGMCVRLYQGDFQRVEVYSKDPLAVALSFEQEGASRLHVVDLDGAAAGSPVNMDVYRAIASHLSIPIQVGGGIRDAETAGRVLETGVTRLVLGTTAVENPRLVQRLCYEYGNDALVISLDTQEGLAAVRGWQETTAVPATELMERMATLGVKRIVYTDISRDGTLTNPNWEAITHIVRVAEALGVAVISSGGISSANHLKRLAILGVEGAIIGKALYTHTLTLQDALAAVTN